jgi:hypothetical protein
MYRASTRMMPIVLNYLPHTLSKLCLESFHLVAIGLQVDANPIRRQQLHSTASYMRQQPLQQQQQANGSTRFGQQIDEQQQHMKHGSHTQRAEAAAADSGCSSSNAANPVGSSSGISSHLSTLPLQQLLHLELEECCVDDGAMAALLAAATGLRTLELAGEGWGSCCCCLVTAIRASCMLFS